jgi:hypothetical protein
MQTVLLGTGVVMEKIKVVVGYSDGRLNKSFTEDFSRIRNIFMLFQLITLQAELPWLH